MVLTWSFISALPYHTCRGKYLKNTGTVSCNQPALLLWSCDQQPAPLLVGRGRCDQPGLTQLNFGPAWLQCEHQTYVFTTKSNTGPDVPADCAFRILLCLLINLPSLPSSFKQCKPTTTKVWLWAAATFPPTTATGGLSWLVLRSPCLCPSVPQSVRPVCRLSVPQHSGLFFFVSVTNWSSSIFQTCFAAYLESFNG